MEFLYIVNFMQFEWWKSNLNKGDGEISENEPAIHVDVHARGQFSETERQTHKD